MNLSKHSKRAKRGDFPAAANPLRWAMIADDLTGACDAGVQFAQYGIKSVVWVDLPRDNPETAVDLEILNTNTRNDSPDAARVKVVQACRYSIMRERELIYGKIDSTLRGNVAVQLEATAEEYRKNLAIVAPAYPALGRTVEEGWLRVYPGDPVHTPSLLCDQGLKNVIHLGRSILARGSRALADELGRIRSNAGGLSTVIFDSITDDDLALIAHAALETSPCPLMFGSAGFAAKVALILASKSGRQPLPKTALGVAGNSAQVVLVVVGSTNPVTRAQVEYLLASRPAVIVNLKDLQISLARKARTEQRHLVINLDCVAEDEHLVAGFVRVFGDSVRGLVLSGGDTAYRVGRALRATGIELGREIAPGIPCGRLRGGLLDQTSVVTKAGGFGGPEALTIATDFLAGRRCPSN